MTTEEIYLDKIWSIIDEFTNPEQMYLSNSQREDIEKTLLDYHQAKNQWHKGCRKSVQNFATQMELALRNNDHKGGWEKMEDQQIVARILEETGELLTSLIGIGEDTPESEAIDIGNFAMMLWDNVTQRNKALYKEIMKP